MIFFNNNGTPGFPDPAAAYYSIDSVYDDIIYPQLRADEDGWCSQTGTAEKTKWILVKASATHDDSFYMEKI